MWEFWLCIFILFFYSFSTRFFSILRVKNERGGGKVVESAMRNTNELDITDKCASLETPYLRMATSFLFFLGYDVEYR